MCVPRNGIYWVRKPQGALLQAWLFVLVVVGRSVTVGRIVEPTYGLTAQDQPGLLRAAGDPWPCSYQAHMARADTQLLHTLHVTNTMLCLEYEITCLMLAELSPIPSLLQPLRSLSQKNSCKIILMMMMMMQMILTGGKGRVMGGGGEGKLAGLITSFQPESCLCEYWRWGAWESGVIVTFSLWLQSISNRTAGRTQAFPSASSWACQPIRHLRDYQQLEK